MNNFIFENSTKVYFGKGCVKEYLVCLTEKYGERVMLCYGGGSIKKNGIYEEVTEKLKSAGKRSLNFRELWQIQRMGKFWREPNLQKRTKLM